MPDISVIVPVYNSDPFLYQSINSVLQQTFSDFELILVDDGSNDRSGAICDEYVQNNENIIIIHQPNQGQAAARNRAVLFSNTEWLIFIDSDDISHPRLAEFLHRAKKEDESLICACSRIQADIIPADFYNEQQYSYRSVIINEDSLAELYKDGSNYYWALFPSLIKKEIYQLHPLPVGRIYEDNAVCFKWLIEAGKITIIDSPLYYYRNNPNGTMNRNFSLQKLDYLWALNEQLQYYYSKKYTKMLQIVFNEYVDVAAYYCHQMEKYGYPQIAIKRVAHNALNVCNRYHSQLKEYKSREKKLKKKLYPFWFRLKKAIKRRIHILA